MFKKKILVLAIFFVLLISVSAVSAADNVTGDIGVEKAVDDVVTVDKQDNINVENNQGILGENENIYGNFTELTNEIESTGEYQTLSLNNSYVFDSNCDSSGYITLNKPLIIDGNNYFIDAKNSTDIFNIKSNDITLKNIIFKNAKGNGAIVLRGGYCTIINCTFINNTITTFNDGGAICVMGNNCSIINCTFINNTVVKYSGGAICVKGTNCSIINSTFENNSAVQSGNCIIFSNVAKNGFIFGSKFFNNDGKSNSQVYFTDVQAIIINCQFYNNNNTSVTLTGRDSKIINSTFKSNNGYSINVASTNCLIDKCNFEDNLKYSISMSGTYNSTIINCNFTNNYETPVWNLNSINGSIINCSFNKNRHYSIFWRGTNGSLYNSTFTDNIGSEVVGWQVNNGLINNNTFKNNNVTNYDILISSENTIVENCTFLNNAKGIKSGALKWDGSNGSLKNSMFNNCSANLGGAISWSGSNGSLNNLQFLNNHALHGGAIQFYGDNLTISDCRFDNCSAKYGGAIRDSSSNLTISNCSFINCSANNGGGVIYEEKGELTILNCTFENSTCTKYGGAIYIYDGILTISNSNFNNNEATGSNTDEYSYGGSIYTKNKLYLLDCNFTNDYSYNGGSIYIEHNSTIFGCNFENCSSNYGGAIYSKDNNLSISDCSFMNCSSKMDGGAIYNRELYNSSIYDCSFMNCFSKSSSGGAIYNRELYNSSIYDCSFMNCSANYGGAISSSGDNSTISNCNFVNCSAIVYGGSLVIVADNFTLSNSNFTSNSQTIRISNSKNVNILNNTIDVYGNCESAIRIDGRTSIIDNNIITVNGNDEITGLYLDAAKSEIINNEITSNGNSAIKSISSNVNLTIKNNGLTANGKYGDDAIEHNGGTIYTEGNTKVLLNPNMEAISNSRFNETTLEMVIIINVSINETATENVTVIFYDSKGNIKYHENVTIIGGKANFIKSGLYDGEYNYTIDYLGDDNFKPASINGTVTVNDPRSVAPLDVVATAKFDTTELVMFVTINTTSVASGNVTVTFYAPDGSIMCSEDVDYRANADWKANSVRGNVTVNDPRSVAPLDVVAVAKFDTNELVMFVTINTTSVASGNVTVTFYAPDGSIMCSEDVDAIFTEPYLADGVYNYTVEYKDNADWKANSVRGNVTVNDTRTTPDVDKVSLSINGQSGTIELPNDAQGNITLTIAGKVYETEVINGVANVKLPNLDDGKYDYNITYSGDGNYSSFTKTGSVTVINPKIVAKDTVVQYSAKGKYSVTVYGSDGKVASGIYVVFEISGKQVAKVKTNAKGVATYIVTKNPGTYKISATALEKTVTKKLTVKHILKLQKVKVKRSAKKLVIKATVVKVNGKYLKGKKIILKFKGKKYKAKTNKKGVAKFTIKSKVLKKLKKGKKVTYQATYLKDTVKKTVKVK